VVISNHPRYGLFRVRPFLFTIFFLTLIFNLLLITNVSAADVPDFFVPPPPFSEDIFPCSECHADLEVNEEHRELDFHEDIKLKHAEEQRWCLDCHNPADRDKLRLANGQTISFETSYNLCGQCHGTIFRDWKAGVHGTRTGFWNGKKQYRLCVHCHNPHNPRFKPIEPLPPPIRPDELKYTKSEDDQIPRNPLTSNYKAERKDVKEKH